MHSAPLNSIILIDFCRALLQQLSQMITPEQCRAARGLLDWSQSRLAEAAHVGRQTVVDFERGVRSPREESLKAMQEALERERVEFISSDDVGPAVRLRPSIWRLTPINPSSLNWKASTYCGELIIRAVSERRARQIAGLALNIAVEYVRPGPTISNPWNRIVGEASCERRAKSEYDDEGPEAILFPEEYDDEWRW